MHDTGLRQRLAAILAADVAGYSRLMAIDERATVAALDEARGVFRSAIESHQGRVIDMAGDSVLAVFETATGAVSTALVVQQQLEAQAASLQVDRRMRFRIGIHLGDVIEKADGSVYGDGVSIAARLEGLAEPGGISVSDAVRGAVGRQVAALFEDQGEQAVKNIADPVRAFRVRAKSGPMVMRVTGSASWVRAASNVGMRWWVAGGLVLALVAVSSWALLARPWQGGSANPLPHSLSVAVMPFAVADGSADYASMADALGQELTTALSRWRWAKVAASGLTAGYKGQAVDGRRIGRDLNVRYIVEGEIRPLGDKLGVTARLIDTENATQVWSERYEIPAASTSPQQLHLKLRLANQVRTEMTRAATDRAVARPDRSTPIDEVLRGDAVVGLTPASLRAARSFYDKALQLDPQFVPALSARAWLLGSEFQSDPNAPKERLLAEMDALSEKAVSLDRRDADAWALRADSLAWLGRWPEAFAANEKAMALQPDSPRQVSHRAILMLLTGRQPEAEALLLRAIEMDPPGSAGEFRHLCFARLLMGRYDEALPDCERSAALDRWFEDQMLLASLYALKGEAAKAALARAELLKSQPGMTIVNSLWMRVSDVPAFRKQLEEHANAGLRKAGDPRAMTSGEATDQGSSS